MPARAAAQVEAPWRGVEGTLWHRVSGSRTPGRAGEEEGEKDLACYSSSAFNLLPCQMIPSMLPGFHLVPFTAAYQNALAILYAS